MARPSWAHPGCSLQLTDVDLDPTKTRTIDFFFCVIYKVVVIVEGVIKRSQHYWLLEWASEKEWEREAFYYIGWQLIVDRYVSRPNGLWTHNTQAVGRSSTCASYTRIDVFICIYTQWDWVSRIEGPILIKNGVGSLKVTGWQRRALRLGYSAFLICSV